MLAVAVAVFCVGCGKSVDKSAGKTNEQREAEAWEKMQKGDGKAEAERAAGATAK